jgi:hypothetical protein
LWDEVSVMNPNLGIFSQKMDCRPFKSPYHESEKFVYERSHNMILTLTSHGRVTVDKGLEIRMNGLTRNILQIMHKSSLFVIQILRNASTLAQVFFLTS